MLECHIVTAGQGEEQETVKTTRGCPQGGGLLPLLWSPGIDNLLNDLDRQGFEVIGFADVLVITLKRRNNDSILSEKMQSTLNYLIGLCKQGGLSINPAKTLVISFIRRSKLSLKNPVVSGVQIEFSKEPK
jgi:Reverse transcriptase (RNA-dependent DNA polymerase)